MDSALLRIWLLVSLAGVVSYVLNKRVGKDLPLPPGPPADPLIGHLRVFPKVNPELVFHNWAKTYGDVIHLSFFEVRTLGRSVDSLEAAVDLLEKSGAIYSDRPDLVVYDLMGWTPNLAFLPYGERFKKHRAIFHFFKFLAMLLYPECQKRGQDEVDCVIGKYMLPSFDDIESLPYVNCVVQEVFRFVVFILSKGGVVLKGLYIRGSQLYHYVRVVKLRSLGIPIAVPRMTTTGGDAIALTPSTYKDPSTFDSTRFLSEADGGRGEPLFEPAFGFGRRICPGRHLANASVFIAVATIFSTLNISTAKDENGSEVTPSLVFETGLTSHPKPFPCNVGCRSGGAAKLIQEVVDTID